MVGRRGLWVLGALLPVGCLIEFEDRPIFDESPLGAAGDDDGKGGGESGGGGGEDDGTGGARGGGGGTPSQGGGPGSGGAGKGGSSGSGGSPTGGAQANGGARTGGSNSGGAATGGVSTGGASTGGASTGGASTGGASTGGASTGGAGSCDVNTPPICIDSATVEFCEEGVLVTDGCAPLCLDIGFNTGSCDAGCVCDEPLDVECSIGSLAFCFCAPELGEPACTPEEDLGLYYGCYIGDPVVADPLLCMASYAEDDGAGGYVIDCQLAADYCLL